MALTQSAVLLVQGRRGPFVKRLSSNVIVEESLLVSMK